MYTHHATEETKTQGLPPDYTIPSCFSRSRTGYSMATDSQKLTANNNQLTAEENPNTKNSTDPVPNPSADAVTSSTVDLKTEGDDSKTDVDAVAPTGAEDAPVTDVQKKMRRAERFGMPVQLSETEKRNSRAERFGTAPQTQTQGTQGSEASKKSEELKRKARAERFGLPVPTTTSDEEAKKKARAARFAPYSKPDSVEEDKRKARALRFAAPQTSSLSQAIGEGNIEPTTAIAGKAGGGD